MAGKKVLIVDDSPTELKMVSAALQDKGYTIITATDGEEALEKTTAEQPNLLVLDVVLPKKNGFQVCRQLRTAPDTKDIKIVLLTAKTQDTDRYWGLKQGADEYITKPFDDETLVAAVEKLLG